MNEIKKIPYEFPEIQTPRTPLCIAEKANITLEQAEDTYERNIASTFESESDSVTTYETDGVDIVEEVYFRDEDEFDFSDIPMDEALFKKILDYFKPENWEKLDDPDKMAVMKALVNYLAEKLDIPRPPQIRLYYGPLYQCGYYNPVSNTININVAHLDDSKETLDTIAHETRHAYQHMRAYKLENMMDLLFKINLTPENYVSWEMSPDLYESQLVEADARAFADYVKSKLEGEDNGTNL